VPALLLVLTCFRDVPNHLRYSVAWPPATHMHGNVLVVHILVQGHELVVANDHAVALIFINTLRNPIFEAGSCTLVIRFLLAPLVVLNFEDGSDQRVEVYYWKLLSPVQVEDEGFERVALHFLLVFSH